MSRRFKDTFIGEGQGARSVMDYVIGDVMIPAFRDLVSDAITEAVNRMFYGDRNPPPQRRSSHTRPNIMSSTRPTTNYSRYSSQTSPSRTGRGQDRYEFDDIILPTINEVREVITALRNDIEEYEFVTVANLFEMVGTSFDYTDERWGWYDLSGAYPKRVSNGFLLVLPPVQPRG